MKKVPSEYRSWTAMKARCYNPNSNSFKRYGALGTTVCERWKDSYLNFIQDMGNKPSKSHSLDRIDVKGNYEPSNCKWATKIEQGNNRRNTIYVVYEGEKIALKMLCRKLGLDYERMKSRVRMGWDILKAINTPKILPDVYVHRKAKLLLNKQH